MGAAGPGAGQAPPQEPKAGRAGAAGSQKLEGRAAIMLDANNAELFYHLMPAGSFSPLRVGPLPHRAHGTPGRASPPTPQPQPGPAGRAPHRARGAARVAAPLSPRQQFEARSPFAGRCQAQRQARCPRSAFQGFYKVGHQHQPSVRFLIHGWSSQK